MIRRFSEDVHLTFSIQALAPDLPGECDALPKSHSEEMSWTSEIRRRLHDWVAGTAEPVLAEALPAQELSAALRPDAERSSSTISGSGYVTPSVTLELGACSTGEPASIRVVTCDAAAFLDGVVFPAAKPRDARGSTCSICQGSLRGERFSRHWHDLVRLDGSEIADAAMAE